MWRDYTRRILDGDGTHFGRSLRSSEVAAYYTEEEFVVTGLNLELAMFEKDYNLR